MEKPQQHQEITKDHDRSSRMARLIAHHCNNLLTVILLSCQELRDSQINQDQSELITTIENTGFHLAKVIKQIQETEDALPLSLKE